MALHKHFTPAGPGHIRCTLCGVRISSNAFARASHERSRKHAENEARQRRSLDNAAARRCEHYHGTCPPDGLCPDDAYCHKQEGE